VEVSERRMISSGDSWKMIAKGFEKFEKLDSVFYTDWLKIIGFSNQSINRCCSVSQ